MGTGLTGISSLQDADPRPLKAHWNETGPTPAGWPSESKCEEGWAAMPQIAGECGRDFERMRPENWEDSTIKILHWSHVFRILTWPHSPLTRGWLIKKALMNLQLLNDEFTIAIIHILGGSQNLLDRCIHIYTYVCMMDIYNIYI